MKLEFFPIDVDSIDREGRSVIRIFGKTSENARVCVVDEDYRPYFHVVVNPENIKKLLDKIKKIKINIEGRSIIVHNACIEKKVYLGKEVSAIKVEVDAVSDIYPVSSEIKGLDRNSHRVGLDIPFQRRYLADKEIVPLKLYVVNGKEQESNIAVDEILAESITPGKEVFLEEPRTLAFDIECYNSKHVPNEETDPVIIISLYGDKNYKKVLTWKKSRKMKEYVEVLSSEAEMIERFKEEIKEYRPDCIVGYFSDGFDFPYLKTRASKYGIRLDLGLDYSGIRMNKRWEMKTVLINGIAHIDVFRFIRGALATGIKSDSFSLDNISKELLNENKKEVDIEKLYEAWDAGSDKLADFCEYCLQDSRLAYKLFKKVLPNINEFVKIVGQPPAIVTRMSFGQMVEWHLIRCANKYNQLVPGRPVYDEITKRRMESYIGAFVYEPEPGLYENLAVFDFRSLYPSIITSYNIDPGTITTIKKDSYETPVVDSAEKDTRYYFSYKKDGFIPIVLREIIERRNKVKEFLKKHTEKDPGMVARREALKVLVNSFYGYLGFSGSRWYSNECAAAIAAYGRDYIKKTMESAENFGFKVIYGDSLPFDRKIFVQTPKRDIMLIKIGDLYNLKITKGYKTLSLTKNNQVKFRPIRKVIRHRDSKKGKLLKIITSYGSTVVTNQHSVYVYKNGIKLVDAGHLKEGDFLISLTNPEVNVCYKRGYIFDIAELDLGDYNKELRLYADMAIFPNKLGICPYCKRHVHLSSHVYSKHKRIKEGLNKKSSFNFVGGTHTRSGRIPRYWILDEDLAWILGYYCADGSVSDMKTRRGWRKTILSFGSQDLEIIKKVKNILDKKIGTNLKIIKNYDGRIKKYMYYYRVQRFPMVALFQNGFGCGKLSEFKKVPNFVLSSEEKLRRAFLKGYLDGDGNQNKERRYKTKFFKISTKSNDLAIGLQFLFKSLDHGSNYFNKKIEHVSWRYRKDKPKIYTLRLQSAKYVQENFCLAKITEIRELDRERHVYDLEVEGSHNFVDAEGMILVHNTDSVMLSLNGKTEKDALGFLDRYNEKLPGLMELELEDFYPRGIFVSKKSEKKGAKKKYALINRKGELKIIGFETIRGDWSIIAKEVQLKVIREILDGKDVTKTAKYVKNIIRDIRDRKIEIEKMVIVKQLRKDISDYENVGPHVEVAKRLTELGYYVGPGSTIGYVVTEGPGIVRERAKLLEEAKNYDVEYYVKNQIVPAVIQILEVLGIKEEDLKEDHKQRRLGEY
ncbi:ribonuclease H-like domain-containing protein [Candidatus Woesearchaeota archaeon]|nr:ribonuclease H-like domain-containing protein [Candidatus Woesearchaeota archaeon]